MSAEIPWQRFNKIDQQAKLEHAPALKPIKKYKDHGKQVIVYPPAYADGYRETTWFSELEALEVVTA